MLQTCDWGVPSPPACVCSYVRTAMVMHARVCAHFHGHAHGHGHTCTGMRTAMVMRARSLTCTAIVIPSRACARPRQRPGTLLTRPAYGLHRSSSNPAHSNALRLRNTSADLQSNWYSKHLGGMGVNVDDGVNVDARGASTCMCDRA